MDKQKQMIAIAGAVAAVVGLGGCRGGDTPPASETTATSPNPAGGPGGATGQMPAMMPGMPGSMAGTTGSASFAAPSAPAAPAAKMVVTGPTKPAHVAKDPFLVTWKNPPPPPYIFDTVQPIRVASANIVAPPPNNTEVREVPQRRVSGIMSGDGVFAILEGIGEPEIVKPGMQTRDGYKVVSISSDSVRLQRQDENGFGGKIMRTQIVPLTDVPIAGAQPSVAAFQGGPPGMIPGGPGRPGPRVGGAQGGGAGAAADK